MEVHFKNAYINRDFDNDALKDTGSWSQAASLFYKSKMHDTPLIIADKPITIGADASVQYAVRLSSDKHVADTVLPLIKKLSHKHPTFKIRRNFKTRLRQNPFKCR